MEGEVQDLLSQFPVYVCGEEEIPLLVGFRQKK